MKLVAVCAGKGGTGKSCASAYIALALGAQNKKVLLIDAGKAPGSLDIILGAENLVVFNLYDVLSGKAQLDSAIIAVPNNPNVSLLPSGIAPDCADDEITFTQLLNKVKDNFDFVIVDSAENASFDVSKTYAAIIVTTPDTLAVRAATQVSRELHSGGAKHVRLIINNVPPRVIPMKNFVDFDQIIDQVGARLIGVVPTSGRLHHSANNGLPLNQESVTVQIFAKIAERLRGKQVPLVIR